MNVLLCALIGFTVIIILRNRCKKYRQTHNEVLVIPSFDVFSQFSLKTLVINLKSRPDKWDSMQQRLVGIDHERSEGVNLHEDFYLFEEMVHEGVLKNVNLQKNRYGHAGLTIAHLHAWRRVTDQPVLILEDDTKPLHIYACMDCVKSASDFDMILMNALRPRGAMYDESLHLLKVKTRENLGPKFTKKPNIWLSAYILSPRGVQMLMDVFKKHPIDVNSEEFDKALIYRLKYLKDFNFYVVKQTNLYFLHDESDSDKKRNSVGQLTTQ